MYKYICCKIYGCLLYSQIFEITQFDIVYYIVIAIIVLNLKKKENYLNHNRLNLLQCVNCVLTHRNRFCKK